MIAVCFTYRPNDVSSAIAYSASARSRYIQSFVCSDVEKRSDVLEKASGLSREIFNAFSNLISAAFVVRYRLMEVAQ